MSSQNDESSSIDGESENDGYEPQAKKRKLFLSDATRAETYLVMTGRVHLSMISWISSLHRGARDIMPLHVHDIAADICTRGTSQRRYAPVKLVEVPERFRARWLSANKMKAAGQPLLANFQAVSHTEPIYATLCGSHFVYPPMREWNIRIRMLKAIPVMSHPRQLRARRRQSGTLM